MPSVADLHAERRKLVGQVTDLMARADLENRQLSDDEQLRVDRLLSRGDTIQRYLLADRLDAENRNTASSLLRQSPGVSLGFEQRDLEKYSLLRAIRLVADGRPLDGLEKEVSDEIAIRSGKQAKGFFMPLDLPIERRDLTLTTGAGAKPTITDATQFIELLRNRTIVHQMGARTLTNLSGSLSLPKHTAGATAYWVAEGDAPTESEQTIGQVPLTPKTVGAFTDVTRKFILQSSLAAEQFVRDDFAKLLAIEIDRAALNGSGSGAEPQGILQNSSVPTVALGTNGAAPTWAKIVELESAVAASNADIGKLGYATNAKVRGKLKTTEKASNTAQFIWHDDNTVNGYGALVSQNVPANLTKGSGENLSAAIFGNWDDLIIAYWSGLDILVDPYTFGTSGTVRIVVLQDVDIKLRRVESFAKSVDIVTT